MRRIAPGLILSILVVALPSAVPAQRRPPPRPRVQNPADSNDARAAYAAGAALLEADPRRAGHAFYWAEQLDPGWPEALYAQRVAGFMANEDLMIGYFEGTPSALSSREAQRLDSLEYRAQMMNPLFARDLDAVFMRAFILAWIKRDARRAGAGRLDDQAQHELAYQIDVYLRGPASYRTRGAVAASEQQWPEAIDYYRRALSEGDRVGVQIERARVFAAVGALDSAMAALTAALGEIEAREANTLTPVYYSKELFHHTIALLLERRRDFQGARDAFGRALQEDLGYYPAHVRLAGYAIAMMDTAAAVRELGLAVEVAPREVGPTVSYAALLAHLGQPDSARALLRRATELVPYYALPHFLLGRVGEMAGDSTQAVAAYTRFLALAAANDPRRADATQRVAALGP